MDFPLFPRLRWLALVTCVLSLTVAASAAIIVGGTINQDDGTGTVQITAPITFTVLGAGTFRNIVMKDWVTSDGSFSGVGFTSGLSYSINGGAAQTASVSEIYDNFTSSFHDFSPGDGFFKLDDLHDISVNPGDTFSLLTGSYTTYGNDRFNPLAIQTFTGNLFLIDVNGDALSGVVAAGSAVPEPATDAALAGLAVLSLAFVSRRRIAV